MKPSKPTEPSPADKIKEYWDDQALHFGADCEATTPDRYLRELEVAEFIRWLPDVGTVLDVGCGNAWSTIRYAKAKPRVKFTGMDFSQKMLDAASAETRKLVDLKRGDVTKLPVKDASYDCVMTDRCLINLTTEEDQRKALDEIARVLKPGGIYLMCENWVSGLDGLNRLRKALDLDEIKVRWHNLYLSMALANYLHEKFILHEGISFASTYYIASRVFNARLAKDEGKEPDYHARINEIALKLPPIGDIGPMKMIVLRKR